MQDEEKTPSNIKGDVDWMFLRMLFVDWIFYNNLLLDVYRIFFVIDQGLPSGYVKIAIENCHRNSGFSHEKWWFSIVVCMFTRGNIQTLMGFFGPTYKGGTQNLLAGYPKKPSLRKPKQRAALGNGDVWTTLETKWDMKFTIHNHETEQCSVDFLAPMFWSPGFFNAFRWCPTWRCHPTTFCTSPHGFVSPGRRGEAPAATATENMVPLQWSNVAENLPSQSDGWIIRVRKFTGWWCNNHG